MEFGKTHVVRPKGKHQATIVWLHGLGDNGLRYICIPSFLYILSLIFMKLFITILFNVFIMKLPCIEIPNRISSVGKSC